MEAVEGEEEEEGEEGFGDEDAGEEEGAGGGEDGERGVKGGGGVGDALRPAVGEQGEGEDAEGEREVDGEGVFAEEFHGGGDEPVGERRFFKIANAVDVKRDPVRGAEHGAGSLGVGGVGVVEQRWREQRRAIDRQPEEGEEEEMFARGGGGLRVDHVCP